jgi:MinD-like ATPase involved in chromosome partitioning or flagellar assembly
VSSDGGTYTLDTANGPTFFDEYAGWSRNQSGREQVLKLVLDTPKDIVVTDTNADLDVHVVQFSNCADTPLVPVVRGSGTNAASFTNARPGIYYLVVDGAQGAVGTTTVTVNLTEPGSTHAAK